MELPLPVEDTSENSSSNAARSPDAQPIQAEPDVLVYSGAISDIGAGRVFSKTRSKPTTSRHLDMLLTTHGGSPDAAFRIMRFLRRHYDRIVIHVPAICKSAGTLMVLGADELCMSETAHLGPLDVQVAKVDELGESSSTLTPTQSLVTLCEESFRLFETHFFALRNRTRFQLSTRTCAEIASKLAVGLMGPVYGHMDPIRLGELQRSLTIARDYGQRLSTSLVRDGALDALVAGYPSHGFVIDIDEAKTLFNNVRCQSPADVEFARAVHHKTKDALKSDPLFVEFVERKPRPRGGNQDAISGGKHDPTSGSPDDRRDSSRATANPAPPADVHSNGSNQPSIPRGDCPAG
ncbi:MAG: hypothetical protein JNL90_12550 [Planctomycetes bacterium]|nr:hypothetical protein [Planctomycetota bacterium]